MHNEHKEITNKSPEVEKSKQPKDMIKHFYNTNSSDNIHYHSDSFETNKIVKMEEYAIKRVLDIINSKGITVDFNKNQGNKQDFSPFSEKSLDLAKEKGIDLHKFVKDSQRVLVYIMQAYEGPDSGKYTIHNTQNKGTYDYSIVGDGHSLMRYAFINDERNEICFSNDENDTRYPHNEGDEYGIVYRTCDNAQRYPFVLKDLGPDALSDRDRLVLTRVLDVLGTDGKGLDRNKSNFSNYTAGLRRELYTKDTIEAFEYFLQSIASFKRFRIKQTYETDDWLEAAIDAIDSYNGIKCLYKKESSVTILKNNIDKMGILRDIDKQ